MFCNHCLDDKEREVEMTLIETSAITFDPYKSEFKEDVGLAYECPECQHLEIYIKEDYEE